MRGSNLPAATTKIMVLPEEREGDFQRKMQSPLFSEHFEKEAWQLMFFGALRQAFIKSKEHTALEALVGVKRPISVRAERVREGGQTYMDAILES